MKRSQQVVLILSGALTTGLFSGCSPNDTGPYVSSQQTYTNNQYVPGVGYYHAPYYAWFPHPYNFYQAGRGYYHGGNWSQQPEQTSLTQSSPRASSVGKSRASSSHVTRGGFGSSSRSSIS